MARPAPRGHLFDDMSAIHRAEMYARKSNKTCKPSKIELAKPGSLAGTNTADAKEAARENVHTQLHQLQTTVPRADLVSYWHMSGGHAISPQIHHPLQPKLEPGGLRSHMRLGEISSVGGRGHLFPKYLALALLLCKPRVAQFRLTPNARCDFETCRQGHIAACRLCSHVSGMLFS